MLTATPELTAAINSPARGPVSELLVWTAGDTAAPVDFTFMVESWTCDRTPSDTPDNVSRFAGSISAKLTVVLKKLGDTLPGGDGLPKSRDLAPYVGGAAQWLAADYGIGVKVQLRTGYRTTSGAELLPHFIGRVDGVDVAEDGSVVLTCLDYAADLQGDVDLPPVGVTQASSGLPLYVVIEHLLRKGGFHRTPPPLRHCVLSVPALLPEVGDIASPLVVNADLAGLNTRYAAPGSDNRYMMTETYAPRAGLRLIIEGWWKASSSGSSRTLVTIGADVNPEYGGNDGFKWQLNSNGSFTFSTIGNGGGGNTPAGIWPNDSGWHYMHLDLRHHPAGSRWTLYVDNTMYAAEVAGMKPADNDSRVVILGGLRHEGFSIRYEDDTYTRSDLRQAWTPNYSAELIGDPPIIRAIPRGQTGGTAWQMINQIALDSGAIGRWTESGVWRWEERAPRMERRFTTTVSDIDGGRALLASGYSYVAASRRKSVTVDYASYSTQRSTVGNPIWQATDVIVIPRNSTVTLDFETDAPVIGILPMIRTSTATADNTTAQTVPAHKVGDPAANPRGGLTTRMAPTATGFRAIIQNPQPFDMAFWDPATGKPAFILHGWTIAGGEPVLYTAASSERSRDDLTLDSSPWRQDAIQARMMADAIAAETALPAVVFDSQTIVADPRLTVDDVIRLRAETVMDELVNAQIIGITSTDTESTLLVRACWPPTGWVLGVTDRSTLPTSTILVA